MRKMAMILFVCLLVMVLGAGCQSTDSDKKAAPAAVMDENGVMLSYMDGVYEAKTEPDYEGYFCKGTMKVMDNRIVKFDWHIYDSKRDDRIFDETYEEVYKQQFYKAQCRNDLRGAATYAPKLIAKQNINSIDAVSGATWARLKFGEIAEALLNQAIQ